MAVVFCRPHIPLSHGSAFSSALNTLNRVKSVPQCSGEAELFCFRRGLTVDVQKCTDRPAEPVAISFQHLAEAFGRFECGFGELSWSSQLLWV